MYHSRTPITSRAPVSSPYSLPPTAVDTPGGKRSVGAPPPPVTASMLRPGFPGTVPYPSRPNDPQVRYAVYPGQVPGGAGGPTYNPRDGQVFVRQQQPESRDRGPRMTLRPYSMYPGGDGFVRDPPGVHVLPGVPGNPVQLVAPSSNMPGIHPSLASLPHPADIQPVSKRPRMDAREANLGPLRIETRESSKEPGYHPQVEAISPTPEDRPAERDDVRSTKDDLLQKIAKVDREIAKAESQIAKLKKKQQDLEDAANRPTSDSATEDEKPLNQSIAQVVYSENRRKAEKSHASLEKLAGSNDLPLYNQPSDTAVYNQNKRNYTAFKKKLVEYFKKKNDDKEARDRYFTHTYCKLTSIWTKKVDRIENSRKRKEKEGKSREMYEKIFPELRKQREDKERDQRLGTRGAVRSEADMEDVIERLQEQEMEDKKMHAYAVIPPPLLPPEDRKRKFTNNNGLIQDPLLIYNERKFINMWTGPEKDIFQEKYLQHPKNFGLIAQYLERKTVSDCVQYYYLSKKTENYKQLLRKSRQRTRRNGRQNAAPTAEVIAPNVPGVVTRRTVQDLQKGEANSEALRGSRSNTPQPSTPIKVEQENGETDSQNEKEVKGKERSREKKSEAANESSDDDEAFQAVKGGPHPCVLCKLMVDHSRPVQKSQAGLLGVKEEEVTAESRVCNNCWCKTIRRKHAHCPLPTCTTSKGKVKGRLRHLPSKLNDLQKATKEAVYSEFQITEGMKKCCTTCFTRLSRRISDVAGMENSGKPEPVDVPWSEDDIEMAKQCLLQHGPDWKKMAEKISSKGEEQCKKFFYRERKKLSLDKLVQEFKKANLPEGSAKPTLTSDEEESGSSTSSCEDEPMPIPPEENNKEGGAAHENSTDKNKDLKPPAAAPGEVKPESKPEEAPAIGAAASRTGKPEEDYDSSATMSADEGANADVQGGVRPPQQPAQIRGRPIVPPPPGVATPPGGTRADMVTVNDLMNSVIEHSLETNASTAPTTTAPAVIATAVVKKPEVSNLHHMLQVAGPSPHQTNYVRNNLGKGGKVIPRPDLEVRPIAPGAMAPPQAPNPAAPPGGAAAAAAAPSGEGEVLNLTVPTRRERSPPHQAVALGPRDQYRDPNTAPRPTHQVQTGTPPPAHGGTKTTHARIMNQTYEIYRDPFRPDSKSPAPNSGYSLSEQQRNRSSSVHSPGPSMVVRGDPREHVKGLRTSSSSANSLPPPLQHNKPPSLSITPGGRPTGSIVAGTPVSQHSPRYDTMLQPSGDNKPTIHRGSITTGIPVYPDRRHPANMMPDPGRASLPGAGADYHKRNSSPAYPPYQGQRPASHDPSQPRSSVRSVIENDFKTAKTLSRPDGREDYPRGHPPTHSRSFDHHRGLADPRAPIVGDPRAPVELGRTDPRIPDGRPIYSDPRIPMARETHVGDPRADIPGRHEARDMRPEVRGDPRNELRPEMRMGDPREQMRNDPRAAELSRMAQPGRGDNRSLDRSSPYYPNPQMYERMQVSANQRERRTPPSSRPQVIQPSVSQQQPPQRGSLTSGQPIKRPPQHPNQQAPPHRDPVDIYRHPEVSITKQPSQAGPSHVPQSRHGEYGLDALVNVAVQQPKLPENKDRQSSSSLLPLREQGGPSRGAPQDPGNRGGRFPEKRPYDHRPAPPDPRGIQPDPRGNYPTGPRDPGRIQAAAVDLERQRQQLMLQLNQMSEADRLRLLDDQRRAAMEKGLPAHAGGDPRAENNTLTAANLIDIIITHQINQGAVPGGDKSRNSPQTLADGKDSPCKPPSRSPSVKSLTDRDAVEDGGSRPGSTHAAGHVGPQVRTSPGTVGEHIESMINKEVSVTAPRDNRTSPFPVTSSQSDASHEHWKRRPAYHGEQAAHTQPRPPSHPSAHTQPRPPSHPSQGSIPRPNSGMGQLVSDERQIIRVAQNTSPGARPDKPPSRPAVEPISPPNSMGAATLYYQGGDPAAARGAQQNMDAMSRFLAAQQRQARQDEGGAKPGGGANLSPFDYVKHKIAEVMKKGEGGPSDVAKSSHMLINQVPMGPPHKRPHTESETRGSPTTQGEGSNPESPRKRYKGEVNDGLREDNMPDSPGSGEMVIDESARPDSAHSHKTSSPAPNMNDPNHYRAPPPTRASPSMQPPRTSQPSTVPLARYEPLSDDD